MRYVLALLLTLSVIGGPSEAQAQPAGPCHHRSWIPRQIPDAERQWRVVRLARCAAFHWYPGGADEMLAVAWRESHYHPFAANPYSSARGLYQHLLGYWPGRAAHYLDRDWFKVWPVPWWNARAQTIVTARMMAESGGACPHWCRTEA